MDDYSPQFQSISDPRQFQTLFSALEKDTGSLDAARDLQRAVAGMTQGIPGNGPATEIGLVLQSILDRAASGKLKITSACIADVKNGVGLLQSLLQGGEPATGEEEAVESLRRYLGIAEAVMPDGQIKKNTKSEPLRIFSISLPYTREAIDILSDPRLLLDELSQLGTVLQTEPNLDDSSEAGRLAAAKTAGVIRVVLKTTETEESLRGVLVFLGNEESIRIRDITGHYRDGADLSLAGKKLGEILVGDGVVHADDVDAVVSGQRRTGQLLVDAGIVTPEIVADGVRRQDQARGILDSSTVRVPTSTLDKLVNLVGEMVIGVAQVKQIMHDAIADMNSKEAAVVSLELIGRDLQEQVAATRMVSVDDTFERLRDAVRRAAGNADKKVVLKITGGETELDKNVVEQLREPLEELVRNSVEHAIEAPEYRAAKGKDETGTISVMAARREGGIVIEVTDDGRGLAPEDILAKARNLGLVTPDAQPTEHEIFELLFDPRFQGGDRPGGLAAAHRRITELRGRVTIQSEPGTGTAIRLRLPLTLAIIDGMAVRVGSEVLTIPLLSIIEQIRPQKGDVQTVEGRGEVVNVRGEILSLIRFHEFFRLDGAVANPCEALVMVLENEGKRFCALVDEVIGQQQAVIKSLETNFRKVAGTSGATILGDGRISLIVDVGGLARMAFIN